MTQAGYKQFCPVAMAAEVLCTRWTMMLLRELVAGTKPFSNGHPATLAARRTSATKLRRIGDPGSRRVARRSGALGHSGAARSQ